MTASPSPSTDDRRDDIPTPRIRSGELHVWLASTDVSDDELDTLARCLTDEEQARVRRFRFDADRRRGIVSRSALRRVLGDYTGVAPESVALVVTAHGKPEVVGRPVEFNASHSGGYVAIALAVGTPVGIDIERVRPMGDEEAEANAWRFFSDGEAARIAAAGDKDRAFFAVWTAKEAVVKAVGSGLGAALASFTVPERMETFSPVACHVPDERELHGWFVKALDAPPGYCAAVAARGAAWEVTVRTLGR